MSKISSLHNQGLQAIISCIAIGQSKRRDLRQIGAPDWKIYSVAYLDDLKDTNDNLMRYVHTAYPGCKYIRDISPEMIQSWLDAKRDNGASQAQIGKLMTHLVKLEKCYKHKYSGIDLRLGDVSVPVCKINGKQRDLVMDDDAYHTILAAMPKTTQAYKSIILSHTLGLRIDETANIHEDHICLSGGRWGYGYVVLHGSADGTKGGRWRTVDILSQADADAVKTCLDGVKRGQTVICKADGTPYKPDSLNRAIERSMSKIGLTEYRQNKNHALRKNFAQRCYDAIRLSGGDKKKAIAYTNQQIGHGDNRRDLTSVYIANQW